MPCTDDTSTAHKSVLGKERKTRKTAQENNAGSKQNKNG